MANSDSSQYTLRYNDISGDLEYGIQNNWVPIMLANAGGITQLTGAVTAGPGTGSQVTTLSAGVVRPTNISTNPSDNFVFPGNIEVTGYVQVDGSDNWRMLVSGGYYSIFDVGAGNSPIQIQPSGTIFMARSTDHGGHLMLNVGAVTYTSDTFVGTGSVTLQNDAAIQKTTVTGALTLSIVAGILDGQKMTIKLLQDGTGHTVTLVTSAGNFRFGSDITSFVASGASKTDYIGVIWNSTASFWDVVAVSHGY